MIAVLLLALFATSCISSPVTLTAEDPGPNPRLNSNIEPTNYKLNLILDKWDETDAYSGTVDITINLDENVPAIQFHAEENVKITEFTLTTDEPVSVELGKVDGTSDLWAINLQEKTDFFKSGVYVLHLEFTGTLRNDMSGFYRSTYTVKYGENVLTKKLASTQFESESARRAFPCLDEPSLKATFEVTITVPSGLGLNIHSNEEGTPTDNDGKTTVVFPPTKSMSTYLLAFVISEFTCDTLQIGAVNGLVCSRDDAKDSRTFAINVASKILPVMKDFTSHDYALDKNILQLFAIPDFEAGAMENWGLLTFREAALLYKDVEYSRAYKQKVATVVTHELAHQWFGDLVTLGWWDDVFLNEGFATYFEYHAAEAAYKDSEKFDLDRQFLVDQVQTALAYDAHAGVDALHTNGILDPNQISKRFDLVSYNKGGSVLRMVQSIVGLKAFKTALASYIKTNQFGATKPSQLWETFENVNDEPFGDIMATWINEPGFPLLTVSSTDDKITITQEKFTADLGTSNLKWKVPISYSTDKVVIDQTVANVQAWLSDASVEIELKSTDYEWFVLNNGLNGYYRVKYDENLLGKLTKSIAKVAELNRAQLVDDLLELAKAGKIEYTLTLDTLRFLKEETNYYEWTAAFRGFTYWRQHINDEKVYKLVSDYIKELTEALSKNNAFIDDFSTTGHVDVLSNVQSLTWDCNLGKESCTGKAQQLFAEYQTNKSKPNANYRSIVYCNGLRGSENAETAWTFLWAEYLAESSSTERMLLLSGLGCTEDETLLKGYLGKITEDDSKIRAQDTMYPILSVLNGNSKGTNVVLDFLTANIDKIEAQKQTATWIQKVTDFIKQDDQKTKLAALKLTNQDSKDLLAETLKTVDKNLELTNKLETAFHDYFNSNFATNNVIGSITLISAIALVLFNLF